MSYVVNNAGLIKDPYVLAELEQIQAKLKGLSERVSALGDGTEKPDQPVPTQKGDPTNPDRTTPSTIGVRWITGPWLIGVDGDGTMPKIASYAVQIPSPISTNQNNFALNDSAIIVELYPTAAFNLTGLRQAKRQRRVVGILNRGSFSISIINQSTGSETTNRFSWGTSGDAGEAVVVPTGAIVWVFYDLSSARWRLFGIPAVGGDNLPPSIVPEPADLPFDFHWFASSMIVNSAGAGVRGVLEDTPVVSGGAAVVADSTGMGVTCTTGAIVGNLAGVSANATPPRIVTAYEPIWTTILKTAANISDVRIWVVLSSIAPTNSDDFGGSLIGFRYSAPATDPGWVGVTRDGATQTVSGLVAAITTNTRYKLKVRKAGSSVFFSVNDGTEVEATATLPVDTTGLVWYCYVITNAASAKSLTWYRHHLRGLAEP